VHTVPTTVPSDMRSTHFSPVASVPLMVAMQGSPSVGVLSPDGSLVGVPGPYPPGEGGVDRTGAPVGLSWGGDVGYVSFHVTILSGLMGTQVPTSVARKVRSTKGEAGARPCAVVSLLNHFGPRTYPAAESNRPALHRRYECSRWRLESRDRRGGGPSWFD
jgi:hypothetical protein